MLAFANVFHFLAHKLAGLRGRRFAFTLSFARAFNSFFFWHNKMVSPLETCLDVTKKISHALRVSHFRSSRAPPTQHTTVATEARVRREQAVLRRVRAALLAEIHRSI